MFTEGHCDINQKTNMTNLAILCRYPSSETNDVLFTEIKHRLQHNNGFPIKQSLEDFIYKDNSKRVNDSTIQANLQNCFPEPVLNDIRDRLIFFLEKLFPNDQWSSINIHGPEVDYNGLVFPIKRDFSITDGLFVIGSSTGHFRGILQSFCSGLIVGKRLLDGEQFE